MTRTPPDRSLRRAPCRTPLRAAAFFAVALVPAVWSMPAAAQRCAGCAGSWQAARDADAARKSCPEGQEARCYQAYLAAQNLFRSCLDRGCDTGMPAGGTSAGGGAGSTPDTPGAADADGDGVPDGRDACRGTPPGVAVDARGCPATLLLTVSTPAVNEDDEVIGAYAPGDTVTVRGTVKDAAGAAVPGVGLSVELLGTGVSSRAGTMVGIAYWETSVTLPLDLEDGVHTIEVTAKKPGFADATATERITVAGPKLDVTLLTPDNVPAGTTTRWKVQVADQDGKPVDDARVEVVATNLDSGATVEASGRSQTPWAAGYADPWFTWSADWDETHAGRWTAEVTALKEGFSAGHAKVAFTVGAHLIELRDEPTDVSCHPYCNPHCRWDTVIIDHEHHDTTECFVPATCSLGHEVRVVWTADGGDLSSPASDRTRWSPPATPGTYTVTGTAVCAEDPAVRASWSRRIQATTRDQFWKSATQGRIEMRGFDRVKVERIVGEDPDAEVAGSGDGSAGDYSELEEGQWLDGERWELATGLETKVTLGVYRNGEKVGEVDVGATQLYRVRTLRESTFGWLPAGQTSPYVIFVDIVPDRRSEAIDFSVTTATEVSSVRGTTFFVAFDDASTTVGALAGEVAVAPRLHDGPPRIVRANQWTAGTRSASGPVEPMSRQQTAALEERFAAIEAALSEPAAVPSPGRAASTGGRTSGSERVVFSETFSGDEDAALAGWDVDDDLWAEVDGGTLLLEPDGWGGGISRAVPLDGVCVALDGRTGGDGFTLAFEDRDGNRLHASLSGGEGGAIGLFDRDEPLASAPGGFGDGGWSRFRFCLRDGTAAVEIDGERRLSAPVPAWLRGEGSFTVSPWGWPVTIDNVEVTVPR